MSREERKNLRRIFITVFIFLFVSGCATTPAIRVANRNTSFSNTENNGMVFFKLDCDGVSTPIVYLYLSPGTADPKEKPKRVALHEKGSFNGNFKFDPTYFLLEMPAGRWQIKYITDSMNSMWYLYGLGGYLAMYNIINAELKDVGIGFDVKPGAVVYLGTMGIAIKVECHLLKKSKQMVEFKGVVDEEGEARQILSQDYQKIAVPMEKKLASF